MDEKEIVEMVKRENLSSVIGIKTIYDLFIEEGFNADQALKLTMFLIEQK